VALPPSPVLTAAYAAIACQRLTASCLKLCGAFGPVLVSHCLHTRQGPDQRPPKPRRPVSATSVELAVLLVHETFGSARVTAPEL
jgi:hypothetical protein